MPSNKRIKLNKITCGINGVNISSIQLHFTNEVKSPRFFVSNGVEYEIDVDTSKTLRKLELYDKGNRHIQGIELLDENAKRIALKIWGDRGAERIWRT